MRALTRAATTTTSADDVLVRLARTGDAKAFGILVDARIDRCYRLAWSILSNDADAADVLSALAGSAESAEHIASRLVGRLARGVAGPTARRRLTEALAGIPGSTASRALADLSRDEDRAVALTAAYVLGLREGR